MCRGRGALLVDSLDWILDNEQTEKCMLNRILTVCVHDNDTKITVHTHVASFSGGKKKKLKNLYENYRLLLFLK